MADGISGRATEPIQEIHAMVPEGVTR